MLLLFLYYYHYHYYYLVLSVHFIPSFMHVLYSMRTLHYFPPI